MTAPSLLLFGPVSPRLSHEYLGEIQRSIKGNPDLKFLADTVDELPSLLHTIQQASPFPERSLGVGQLDQLASLLHSGILPKIATLNNTVLAPLTVLSHIAEFLPRVREFGNAPFPTVNNVQGFCIGFLTAAALAVSRKESEFQTFAATALRLALCVGYVVDLHDESIEEPLDRFVSVAICWKTGSGKEDFEGILGNYPSVSIEFPSLQAQKWVTKVCFVSFLVNEGTNNIPSAFPIKSSSLAAH